MPNHGKTLSADPPPPGLHRLKWSWQWRYPVAFGVIVLAWLGREALTLLVGPTALPFIFFFPAVACAAWFGGLGPGVFATLLASAAARWFFIAPVHSFSVRDPRD